MKSPDRAALVSRANLEKVVNGAGPLISDREPVFIAGIGQLDAKVDSGNDGHNVLHVDQLEVTGDDVFFKTAEKVMKYKLGDTITVRKGHTVEERPVILLNITFAEKRYLNVPFSLSNRSGHGEPVLIGKRFLKKIGAIIKFT